MQANWSLREEARRDSQDRLKEGQCLYNMRMWTVNQWSTSWGNAIFPPRAAIFRNEEEQWRYIDDNATLIAPEAITSANLHYQETRTSDVEEVQEIHNSICNIEVAARVTSCEESRATQASFHDVQEPPVGIFNSTHLNWKKMTTMNREGSTVEFEVAYIPFSRTQDFIDGEGKNDKAPTNFAKIRQKMNTPGDLKRPSIESFLQRSWYWCSFGPNDHRNVEPTLEDRSLRPKRGRGSRQSFITRGEGLSRGCRCNFSIKQFYQWPDVAEVCFFERRHVDISGVLCHGAMDISSQHTRAQFARKLSKEKKRWVLCRLYEKATPDQVMNEHKSKLAEKRNGQVDYTPCRDDFLTKQDILNLSSRLSMETFQLHEDDARSSQLRVHNFDLNENPFSVGTETTCDERERVENYLSSKVLEVKKTMEEISGMVSCTRDTLLLDNIVSQLRHVRGICQSGVLSSRDDEDVDCLEPLQQVNDGFGNSLQRAKPLVEVSLGGKRKKTTYSQSDGQLETWREPRARVVKQNMMNLLR